ncbi:MAG: DegQ family serine endoprotease [Smithellaceae bacterium]|nr:DegQ family serine endoprotease [Smithellaceae bacterium]
MKKDNNNRKTFIMFLLAFLIGFFVVSFVEVLRSSFLAPVGPDVQPVAALSSGEGSLVPLSFADLTERVKPAVVNIGTSKTIRAGARPFGEGPFLGRDDFFGRFFGDVPREYKQKSLGSGFIISHDGYIFTNYHVVEQADRIVVKLSDGKEYNAKIIGKDAKIDIALIKIKPTQSLPVVELGDSDRSRVGEWVIAIGNPFGLEQTVTAGIISAKGRVIGAGPYDNFIQTDASINPGNSGGPLFNMEGRVIGINTAIVAQGQGIGFAIPINMARDILSDLKAKGKVVRGWVGVSVQDVTEDIAKNLKQRDRNGALVSEVFKGDPADRAGIKAGDIITAINGKKIKDSHELLMIVANFRVGDNVEIKALRDGQETTFRVIVAERKDHPEVATASGTAQDFGMTVQEITPEMARYLRLALKSGVIVADVREDSAADDVGIQPQDIVLQVNKVKINSLKDYLREVGKRSSSYLFLIKRGKATFFVALHR